MKQKKIYIQAAEQISIQQPLSEQWMKEPEQYNEPFAHAIAPVYKDYINPREVRRMSNIMKRALVTTLKVLQDTGIEQPDAIITGTSIGSLDHTERFLGEMTENKEEAMSPTYFMQSTHNTVSSTLSIYTKTHGYNTTYSHGEISFDLTLQDAWMQMQLGKISNALVGGYDEMIESYVELIKKIEYVGVEGMDPCGEVSMSMMLNTEHHENDLCEFAGIKMGNLKVEGMLEEQLNELLEEAQIEKNDISCIMTGKNGNPANDIIYSQNLDKVCPDTPLAHFKHLFGENFTASAFGVYAAAACLKKGEIPSFMNDESRNVKCDSLNNILVFNQMNGREYSLVLLKKI